MTPAHYLLTRCAYSPRLGLEVSRARLELSRHVTVPSIRAQTRKDVKWMLMVDPADPLLEERLKVFGSAGLELIVRDAGKMERTSAADRPQADWVHGIQEIGRGPVATQRLDDDDALAPWVFQTFRTFMDELAQTRPNSRFLLTLPSGWRVIADRASRDPTRYFNPDESQMWISQFSCLLVGRSGVATVMDRRHGQQHLLGKNIEVTQQPAWAWLRHGSARSWRSQQSVQYHEKLEPLPEDLLEAIPSVDWDFVRQLPSPYRKEST